MERRPSPSAAEPVARTAPPQALAANASPAAVDHAPRPKRGVPSGLWQRCDGCGETIYRKEAEEILNVCPKCGFHWYVSATKRLEQLLDPGTF